MSETKRDTMRGRIEQNRYTFWLLTRLNRWVLAGAVSIALFVALVALSRVGPAPMRRVIETTDGTWIVFSSMLTIIVTVVALVVTFNQLVLSQELGAVGDQRERMKEAVTFRGDVEPWLHTSVAPPDPASFLAALLDTTQSTAEELTETSRDGSTESHESIREFVEELVENAESVGRMLQAAQFGTFDVVFAALNFNYSWKIYEARRLLADHREAVNEETAEGLEDIVTLLEFFGPTREHFKTLYFQWELVNLSRVMLYTAVPALFVALGMVLYVDSASVTGTTVGVDNLVWLVCAGVTISLLPFFLLISYVLRIATVTKRTLAIGPFILRETERTGSTTWE